MRCHSVASFISPLALSFHLSVVATRMLVTASPLGRYFVSGSAPRLPTMITLLTDAMSHPSFEALCLAQRASRRPVDRSVEEPGGGNARRAIVASLSFSPA